MMNTRVPMMRKASAAMFMQRFNFGDPLNFPTRKLESDFEETCFTKGGRDGLDG